MAKGFLRRVARSIVGALGGRNGLGELICQSLGGLHVFLPLRDLGIDGVVHRLSDGAYIAVQVKARTELTPAGQVHITVTARSLVDDTALARTVESMLG